MTKYILKKDLPFAKKGEVICIKKTAERDSGWNFWDKTLYMSNNYFADLISDGWIEEVKPREFWISIDKNGIPISFYNENPKSGVEYRFVEFIKVREVIE